MNFLRIIEQHETRVRVERFALGTIVELEAAGRVTRGRSLDEASAAWLAADAVAEIEAIAQSGQALPPEEAGGPYVTHEEHELEDGTRMVETWRRRADGALIEHVAEVRGKNGETIARTRNGRVILEEEP